MAECTGIESSCLNQQNQGTNKNGTKKNILTHLKHNSRKISIFVHTDGHPLRAYDSLKLACSGCNIQKPETITSTNLRKYMATLAQVRNKYLYANIEGKTCT